MPADYRNSPISFYQSYRKASFEYSSTVLLRLFAALFTITLLPCALDKKTIAPIARVRNPFPFYLNDTYFKFASDKNAVWPVFLKVVASLKNETLGPIIEAANDLGIKIDNVLAVSTCNGRFKLAANASVTEITHVIEGINKLRNSNEYIKLVEKCALLAKYSTPVTITLCIVLIIGFALLGIALCWKGDEGIESQVESVGSIENKSNYDVIRDGPNDFELQRLTQL